MNIRNRSILSIRVRYTYFCIYLEQNEELEMHKVCRDEKTSFAGKLPLFQESLEYLPNLSSSNH